MPVSNLTCLVEIWQYGTDVLNKETRMTAKRTPPKRPPKRRLPKRPDIDIKALAAGQGAKPISSIEDLRADFWPESESTDDFIAALRRWRNEGL